MACRQGLHNAVSKYSQVGVNDNNKFKNEPSSTAVIIRMSKNFIEVKSIGS